MTGPEESGGTLGGRGVPTGAGCGRAARESAFVTAYLSTKSAVRRGASAARSLTLLRGVSAALTAAGPAAPARSAPLAAGLVVPAGGGCDEELLGLTVTLSS